MTRQPIKRIQNHITDTCIGLNKGEVSPEFKKTIDSRFKEKPSELRERRIQKQVRRALDIGSKWDREGVEYVVKEHEDIKDASGDVVCHQDRWYPQEGGIAKAVVPSNEVKTLAPMGKKGTITHEGDKWCVRSHTGKNLGCGSTEEWAKHRLSQVEFFKHQDK